MAQTVTAKTRLAEILDDEGRKQSWLVERTDISRTTISLYVKGLPCPQHHRDLIAEALGREIDDIFPSKASK